MIGARQQLRPIRPHRLHLQRLPQWQHLLERHALPIAEIEKAILEKLELDCLSPQALKGRLVLRPDVANARFEGSLVLSHEDFFEQKQIKLVAGAGFCIGAA